MKPKIKSLLGALLAAGVIAIVVGCETSPPPQNSGGNSQVVQLSDANWESEVVNSKIPVLVDFMADWCGPCKKYAPTIDKVAAKYQGKIKVAKFDVGDNFIKAERIMKSYPFDGIPCVMIFKDGKKLYQSTERPPSEAELDRLIASAVK